MMNYTLKLVFCAFLWCVRIGVVAQEGEAEMHRLECGGELTTELQVADNGKCDFVNLLRLQASVPLSRSISFDVSSVSTCMTSRESIGGDLQTFSNLDAGNVAFALAKCGVGWEVKDGHSLFAGVRNMNEDYFASDVTAFFTNSSCGIYPTIGANFPIANYPLASMGVHYRYEVNENENDNDNDNENDNENDNDNDNGNDNGNDNDNGNGKRNGRLAVQFSLYNGMGYNRFAGRESVFRVCPGSDGVFGLSQIEYQHGDSNYFLGACGHYGDVYDTGRNRMGAAVWAYAEQRLTGRFSLIAGYSHAFVSSAECSDFVGVGGVMSWKRCSLGVFTDYARFAECWESATEVSAKVSVSPRMYIQPAVHFISTNGTFRIASLLRVGVSF